MTKKISWRMASLLLGFTFASQSAPSAEIDLSSLISLYDQGEYSTALMRLKAASKSHLKHNPTAHYYLARTYLMNRQLPPARAEYLKAYELDSGGAVGKLALDALCELEKDPEKKKQYVDRLASLTSAKVGLILKKSRIDFLVANGPAAKSGLQLKDEIVSVDGIATQDLDSDSVTLLFRGTAGSTVPFVVKRKDAEVRCEVVRSDLSTKVKSPALPEGISGSDKQMAEISLPAHSVNEDSDDHEKSSAIPSFDVSDDAAKKHDGKGALEHLERSRKLSRLIDEPNASDNPVQLVMRAAALKAVAALQTDEIKAELLSKAKPLYDTALTLLNKRIAERPFESDLYAIRAHVYDANADYQKGIDEYNFLTQFGVDNPLFIYAKAKDEDGLKRYEDAAADYLHYARMDSSEKLSGSGNSSDNDKSKIIEEEAFKAKHSLIAITPISAALNLPNGSASGYLGAAGDYLNLSDNDKAVEVCSEGLQKNPGEPNLLLRRAEALFAKQDYLKALDDCNVAFSGLRSNMFGLAVDTELGAYSLRAKIYRNLGRDREASMDEETCAIVSGAAKTKAKGTP